MIQLIKTQPFSNNMAWQNLNIIFVYISVTAESIYGNGICLYFVFYSKRYLFPDLYQTRIDRQYDKTKIRW